MKLFRYFTQGLLVLVPISITIMILLKIYSVLSALFVKLNLPADNFISVIAIALIVVAAVILIGIFASSFLFQGMFSFFEKILENTPGIKHVYSPVKDFMQAFVGNKKKFNKPVLVMTNPAAEIEEMGFITNEDLSDFHIKDKVAVYMPHSYAFSGKLLFVPKQHIKIIDAKSGDTMKFIVTGGVADVGEE
ncbi:MAG: DUF502 domain-containing protein [Bacteroidetes bacterium]|nr:DUF502 domain-containing protein [Bacteroidota bacterium]